jgi:hypothetical protein
LEDKPNKEQEQHYGSARRSRNQMLEPYKWRWLQEYRCVAPR